MDNETLQRILDDAPEDWEDLHVVPLDDLLSHGDGTECLCDPRIEIHGGKLLIVHNSFDGREEYER